MTPAFLGDTCRLGRNGEEVLNGIWVGDAITPTNDAPGEGYIDITPEYTIWPQRYLRFTKLLISESVVGKREV